MKTITSVSDNVDLCVSSPNEQLSLPRVFGDNMVLQQRKPLKVWGKTNPCKKVKVTVGKHSRSVITDSAGEWMAVVYDAGSTT